MAFVGIGLVLVKYILFNFLTFSNRSSGCIFALSVGIVALVAVNIFLSQTLLPVNSLYVIGFFFLKIITMEFTLIIHVPTVYNDY